MAIFDVIGIWMTVALGAVTLIDSTSSKCLLSQSTLHIYTFGAHHFYIIEMSPVPVSSTYLHIWCTSFLHHQNVTCPSQQYIFTHLVHTIFQANLSKDYVHFGIYLNLDRTCTRICYFNIV